MKKIKTILMLAVLWTLVPTSIVSCNEEWLYLSGDSTHVTVSDDGKASNGHIFSAIDDKNFYIDYIKYTIEDEHLVVSGYDEDKFSETANIVSSITYKGNTYKVLEIGDEAFFDCSELMKTIIPNTVTSIGYMAFFRCDGLTSVDIPNSVTSIGDGAFTSCSSLTSVAIPESMTSIGDRVFRNCSNLTSVTIPNSVTSIGYEAFYGCSGLTSLSIPNSVTSIGDYAFYCCSGLTSVTIPNSVTSIGDGAFQGCRGLISIIIPNSMTSIGDEAFGQCSRLISVYSLIETPFSISNEVFHAIGHDATLYVPQGTKSAYESTEGWTDYFSNIVEFDATGGR